MRHPFDELATFKGEGEPTNFDLCYCFVRVFPIWKLDPRPGSWYADVILPRAGRWAYRDQ